MKVLLSTVAVALVASSARAQERCDAPYPTVYCNTTEILAYESAACSQYHIFLARGSDEPYPGRQGNATKQICEAIGSNDCSFENIEYPAKSTAWGSEEWCKSAATGARNGQAQMTAYAEKCPDARLILLGYSQGASVAQDILGGGGGAVFACEQAENEALDRAVAPGKNVVAAVTFGAVARTKNQNFTIGAGKPYDGTRARTPTQLKALRQYAGVLLDYCHIGDPICAPTSTPLVVMAHLNYFIQHNEEVVKWVASMAKDGTAKVPGAAATSESSSSAAKSSTQSSTKSSTISSTTSATATPTVSSEAHSAQGNDAKTTSLTTTSSANILATSGQLSLVLAGISLAVLRFTL